METSKITIYDLWLKSGYFMNNSPVMWYVQSHIVWILISESFLKYPGNRRKKSVFCDWIELKRNGYLVNNDRLNPLKIDFPSRINSGFCFVKVTITLILPLSDTHHTWYIYIGHNRSRLTCGSPWPTAKVRQSQKRSCVMKIRLQYATVLR